MGTNYYLVPKPTQESEKTAAAILALSEEVVLRLESLTRMEESQAEDIRQSIKNLIPHQKHIHLGKSSLGWRFTLSENCPSLEQFCATVNLETHDIKDEYNRVLTLDEFKNVVNETRKNPKRNGKGEPIAEAAKYPPHYSYTSPKFNSEGFLVLKGDFC